MKLRKQLEQQQQGGGGSTTPPPAIASAPAPMATPPVTTTNAEVIQAQNDLRRQSLRKRGFSKTTIFAGDTGGWTPQSNVPGPVTPRVNTPAVGGATKLGS